MVKRPIVEILAPAGSMEALKAAFMAGADAVYIGGTSFGARAFANNLTCEELISAIDYAHLRNKSLYLTVNTLLKTKELENELYSFLCPLYEAGLDAVIVQDLGVFDAISKWFPKLNIHASTQMGITGKYSASGMKKLGATRVVPARELSLSEIKSIHEKEPKLEIECFVHGALCYCYSGACLFSSLAGGRSGNRGRCAQPCRMQYTAYDEKNRALPDQKDGYLLSPKELCALDYIPQLIEAGVYSFKIEGRMKKPEYVAGVTRIYRKYVDLYLKNGSAGYKVLEKDRNELLDLFQRVGFTDGFFKRHNGKEMITKKSPIFRTENSALNCTLRENYLKKELQRPVSLSVSLYPHEKAVLTLSCEEDALKKVTTVTATGDEVLEAQNKPLDKAYVKEKLLRMGGSPFIVTNVDIFMDDACFLPASSLNNLRRSAMTLLENELLDKFRRKAENLGSIREDTFSNSITERKNVFSCLVTNISQFEEVLKSDFCQKIYLESNLLIHFGDTIFEKAGSRELFLSLPHFYRGEYEKRLTSLYQKYVDRLSGVLARNMEGLFWAKERKIPVIEIDHSLYTFQSEARKSFASLGVLKDTVPLELNQKELSLRGINASSIVLYGRAPMMVSANCIKKTLDSCDHKMDMESILKDRMKNDFPVISFCDWCYNVIYNFLPTSLHEYFSDFEKSSDYTACYRLDFTVEDAKETKKVLALFHKLSHKEPVDFGELKFTRGHMKRGVE